MKALYSLVLACLPCAALAQMADGWAGQQGGTSGGGSAAAVRVATPAELRTAVNDGAPVIEVTGLIDMRDGRPFADSADQSRRALIHLGSNTTLTGIGPASGLINASVIIDHARNVIVRRLNLRNPCNVEPVWDPADGAKGNWNSRFDAITVSASVNVWIDHNSFTDAPVGDELAPRENGMLKQCHDGALDINQGADLVTVSYNRFALHEKNTLVGSSDKAAGDAGKLRVTFSNNLFEYVSARAPRVRFGQVHLVNNYHVGDRHHPVYPHEYSVGMGKQGDVIGDANVYDIAGARGCGDVVHTWNTDSSFTDRGSTLNGAPLAGCTHPSAPAWRVPYAFSARPAAQVREHVLAHAGADNWQIGDSTTVVPPAGARDVPVDTELRMTFRDPPVLAAGGAVRIYSTRDGALVDVIDPVDQIRAIGTNGQVRQVRMNPVRVRGNSVTILPHSGVLRYDTEYKVVVGSGVIAGVSGRWSFRTRAAPPTGSTLTVDASGQADFRTVQGALNHAMSQIGDQQAVTIKVRNGDYEELLYLGGRKNITVLGQSRDGVLIHATNNEGLNHGAGRALMLVENADLLMLDTLTLRNDTERRHSRPGQAEVLYYDSVNGRLIARNANFFSEQDTLRLRGYAWFYNTLVAGNVDFIWGAPQAALFERSEIRSVGDSSNAANGGYLVQARSDRPTDKGFVFLNSTLTHGPGPAGNDIPAGRTYLARSPGTANTWDNVSFIDCRMDRHIAAAGWAGSGAAREPGPNPAMASANAGWREAGSTDLQGAPLDLSQRTGGLVMDAASLRTRFGSRAAVFSDFDDGKGWDPQP